MKKIKTIVETDDRGPGITITFDDETWICIYDSGQSCCEHRYWVVDDDLTHYIGTEYLGWELRDSECTDESYNVHEIQFLNINNSVGAINIASHNEHNGYYGGFYITTKEG